LTNQKKFYRIQTRSRSVANILLTPQRLAMTATRPTPEPISRTVLNLKKSWFWKRWKDNQTH